MVKPNETLPGYTATGHAQAEPPPIGTSAHEEWLIDVAVEQTFPASDPPASMNTGTRLREARPDADRERK